MRSTLRPAARLYVAVVCLAGFAICAAALFNDFGQLSHPVARGISVVAMTAFLLVFASIASLAPVQVSYGVSLLVNLAPTFAAILILPPGFAGIVGVFGSIERLPSKQHPWYRFIFNRAMHGVVPVVASIVYHAVRSQPAANGSALGTDFNAVAGALLALLIVSFLNSTLVITAVSLETGESVRKVGDQILRGSFISYLGLAPLGAMIAFLASFGSGEGMAMAAGVMLLLLVYRELSKRALSLESVARGSYVAQSRLIDKKDRSTFGHSERVGLLSEAVALKLRLAGDLVEQIRIGATLHDIGKIAVPDNILHKTGKLTDEEWAIMKSHAQEGYDVLKEQEILLRAAEIVWSHHENFDGTGYPRGLAGRAIPVGGRIARVIDSYDCITNVRDYREWVKGPFEALADIETRKGTWYDPEVVDVFINVLREKDPRLAQVVQSTTEEPQSMVTAMRYLPFLKLWLAAFFSNFGDMLTTTGLALAGYGATHSVLALGLVVAVRALPNLLLGLPAGQIVDRYDRKVLMVGMDIARMALVGLLPLLVHAPLALILVVAFLVSTATVLFNPARAAALPDLVPPRILTAANSALAVAERGSEILGYAAAAALIVFGGIGLVFAIDAVTFAASAILLLTIGFPLMVMGKPEASASTLRRVRAEIAAGVQQIMSSPELRAIFIFSFLLVAAGSALLPLMVPLAVEHLHAGNAGFALLEGSIAVGATAGALLTGWLHTPRRGMLMIIGALGMGAANVMAGLSTTLPVTAAFLVVGGVANMVYLVPMLTAIQELTDTTVRGRVFAARFTLVQIGVLVGAAYATVTTSTTVPQASAAGVAVVGTGVLMLGVAAWAGFRSPIRRL